MTILPFSIAPALLGGALIGLSAALLLLAKGRIAGISGIAGGVIVPERGDTSWRLMFLGGLVLGGFIYQWLSKGSEALVGVDHIQAVVDWPLIVIGGLLVGIGTTLGTGCTSGHGICGLARKSPRSLAATLSFMVSGAITVYIVQQLIGGL